MLDQQRWALGVATGIGIMGAAATGVLFVLAHHFVDELSRPHTEPDRSLFSWKVPEPEPEPPPQRQRAVLFRTRDGKMLRGEFWAQARQAPTVVLCHGYRISGADLRPVAALEYKHGYNILLFDFRGHGASESTRTSGGNAEVYDMEAAIAVASQQPETLPGKVIIHAFSMGASIALLAMPHPDVIAIIADSPYAHLDQFLRHFIHWLLMHNSRSWSRPFHPLRNTFHPLSWATVAASTMVFRLRFGHSLIARPAANLKGWHLKSKNTPNLRITPILLIHGTADEAIPISHAYQIAAQAKAYNIPIETYFVEGSQHCAAYGDNPQQYIDVLQRFLAKHLGSDFPGG